MDIPQVREHRCLHYITPAGRSFGREIYLTLQKIFHLLDQVCLFLISSVVRAFFAPVGYQGHKMELMFYYSFFMAFLECIQWQMDLWPRIFIPKSFE